MSIPALRSVGIVVVSDECYHLLYIQIYISKSSCDGVVCFHKGNSVGPVNNTNDCADGTYIPDIG